MPLCFSVSTLFPDPFFTSLSGFQKQCCCGCSHFVWVQFMSLSCILIRERPSRVSLLSCLPLCCAHRAPSRFMTASIMSCSDGLETTKTLLFFLCLRENVHRTVFQLFRWCYRQSRPAPYKVDKLECSFVRKGHF